VQDLRTKQLTDSVTNLEEREKKMHNMFEVADRGIQRIQHVVELLRRVAQEGFSEESVELDFDAAVRDVVALMAPQDGSEIKLELELNAGIAKVRCLPIDMNQVIQNLVQNAFDAAEKCVHVRTKRIDQGNLLFEVEDDGTGIPQDIRDKIFSPFFSTKGPGKGMGIGLTITQQVVSSLGGDITVASTPPQGTFFRVKLPVQVQA